MDRIFGFLALVGFVLSLLTHLVSLAGIDASEYVPFIWTLHLGIFVVFLPFVLHAQKTAGRKLKFVDMKENFPNWTLWTGGTIAVYALINFLVFMLLSGGGTPEISNEKFILQEHGKLISELTQAQYHSFKANEIRGFSGHWLLFYFFPFAYFCFRRNRPQGNFIKSID